jgi:hypothetical protein
VADELRCEHRRAGTAIEPFAGSAKARRTSARQRGPPRSALALRSGSGCGRR